MSIATLALTAFFHHCILSCAEAAGLSEPQPRDGAIRLGPRDPIASIVQAAPEGAIFRLVDGNYRGWSVIPRSRQAFIAEGKAAVLDGSIVIHDWIKTDRFWIATIPPERPGEDGANRGHRRQDLFLDERLLLPVATPEEVAPGRWYRNDATALIADDPSGRLVELSYRPHAFEGDAAGIVLQGLIVRQYGSNPNDGAIDGSAGENWTLIDVSAAHNRSLGVRVGRGMVIDGGAFVWNGQGGIAGRGDGLRIRRAEVSHNNYARHDTPVAAGGIRVDGSNDVRITANYVHHNHGPGLWLDQQAQGLVIDANLVAANDAEGLKLGAAREGMIRGNIFTRNGQSGQQISFGGAEIRLEDSSTISITGNTIVVQHHAGVGIVRQRQEKPSPVVRDLNRVSQNNFIYLSDKVVSGTIGSRPEAPLQNALFDDNRYILPAASTGAKLWHQAGRPAAWSDIRQSGWEVNGSLRAVDDPSDYEPDYATWKPPAR